MSEANSNGNSARNARPLSPHLSIYKPIPTMVTSILHRITGVALYFGMFLFAWWLFAAATNGEYFDWVNGLFGSIIGRVVLFGLSLALVHHALGGIKHLIQDTGRALEKHFTTRLAKLHIAASVLITLVIWFIAYSVR